MDIDNVSPVRPTEETYKKDLTRETEPTEKTAPEPDETQQREETTTPEVENNAEEHNVDLLA